MEMRKITSFQTMQSLGNKEICILFVHDDPRYRNIVAKMLQYCSHYEGIEVGITHKEDFVPCTGLFKISTITFQVVIDFHCFCS